MTSAERPAVSGRMYHVMLGPGDIPPYVLLPGDPARVDEIAASWDTAEIVQFHREFKSARGTYRGAPVAAVSTGIGGPSTAIAVEELAAIGAHTLIRVGTTGAIQGDIEPGTLVIATGAVRMDGASSDYAPEQFPAHASPEVVLALVEAAKRLGARYRVGVVASTATFHLGQSRPGIRGYTWSGVEKRIDDLRRMGVLSFEMEAATIFTLSQIYRLRSGCVCAVIANRVTGEFRPGQGVDTAIRVANEALRILYELDKLRGDKMETPTISELAEAVRRAFS
ncbi:MAG: uridine phosphorylase [Thermoproteota archaeon]